MFSCHAISHFSLKFCELNFKFLHSGGQTVLSFPHIGGITLDSDDEVDEVVGEACGMGVDRIGEADDRASEGQSAVNGAGFTAGSLARKGARDGMRGT
jgi:hypothetical protein